MKNKKIVVLIVVLAIISVSIGALFNYKSYQEHKTQEYIIDINTN